MTGIGRSRNLAERKWAMRGFSKRLIKLADRLGNVPSASNPGACNGKAETQAAYRLFDQARADKRGLGWGTF